MTEQLQTPFNIPVPDPSILTTEQLRRELSGLKDNIETRLNGMDKAHESLVLFVNRTPTEIEKALVLQEKLTNEKFEGARRERESLAETVKTQLNDLNTVLSTRLDSLAHGISLQFDERDIRSKASEVSASTAVSAALQAQKESAASQNEANQQAVAKSEASTVKQMDAIIALLASNSNALNDKISVINGRLDRGEGQKTGITGLIGTGIAIVAAIAAVGSLMISFNNKSTAIPPYPYYQQGIDNHGMK